MHYIVGGTDGVSLEIEKWKQVLESMGHNVYLVAGSIGKGQGTIIEELYHRRPDIERLSRNTFKQLSDYANEDGYRDEFERTTVILYEKIKRFMLSNNIDLVIPNNIWSNSCSPPASVALAQVVQELQMRTIAHHHDFYWESIDGVALTCSTAVTYADKWMPPREPYIKHVVINSLAQRELYERKGIRSTVVPNVFDFRSPGWGVTDHNADFRKRIGLAENDIMVLQATRIVPRKAIEIAIDFVKALNSPARRQRLSDRGLYNGRSFNNDSRIVLVLSGISCDDSTGRYLRNLKLKVERTGIDALFIEDLIQENGDVKGEGKLYSFWDSYVHADIVTYPSLWEGWGNQFLEALKARLPLVLFEYPVYLADIKENGFDVMSLGDEIAGIDELGLVRVNQGIIEADADRAVDLLTDNYLREEVTNHNYQLGQKYYSLETLRDILSELIEF